jgi:hypothetical protein
MPFSNATQRIVSPSLAFIFLPSMVKDTSFIFRTKTVSPPLVGGQTPVKYELFNVTHLESMQQDVEHGYLSLLFNRVKGRGG